MAFWLFKTEPGTFSWDDQVRAGSKGEEWNGVRNALAQKNMRMMKVGDLGFFYHSVHEKQIVGVVKVVHEIHSEFNGCHGPVELRRCRRCGPFSAACHAVRDQGRAKTCRHGAREELQAIRAARYGRGMGACLPDGRLRVVSLAPPALPEPFADVPAIADSACYPCKNR